MPLLLLFLAASLCRAQDAVLDDLEARAKAALERIPRAATAAEADRARPGLRKQLEESLGFRRLPWPPDLKATPAGVLTRKGHRIEKIVFQSLPNVRVPAHLYLPEKLDAPAPAVLFYNGHWWPDSKARPDFQAFCSNMARLGFVVFSFDPFGQGERGVSSRDHRRTETLLVGVSQQGIAEYETRCALEYLLSRKEVDPKRVGMTGASGGGYNTWITAALDDRIAVAVPVVGTSDFYEQIHVTRELDWYNANEHCHFVPGLIRYADNRELLAMAAPKPLLIVAASKDQSFPVAGVRSVYEYGRGLYRSYGVPEKIGYFEDAKEGHGYQKAKREAAYGWFLRWLANRGDGGPVPEPETETLAPEAPELRCFEGGRKAAAGPGIVAAVKALATRARRPAPLGTLMGEPPPEAKLTIGLQAAKSQRVELETQPGIRVPAIVLRPGTGGGAPEAGVLVAVDDRGKDALASDPLVLEALRRNWMVWAVDPRGIGELALQKPGWAFAVSLLLGENFVWRQGWDLRRIAEFASTTLSHRVGLYARGHNAALAATYAVAQAQGRSPEWVVVREGFLSVRQFIDRPRSIQASFALLQDDNRAERRAAFDREIPHEYFVFGALDSFDLPELLARARTRATVIAPINGDWEPMASHEARAALPSRVRLATLNEFLESKW